MTSSLVALRLLRALRKLAAAAGRAPAPVPVPVRVVRGRRGRPDVRR
jgi:hypothetical protein